MGKCAARPSAEFQVASPRFGGEEGQGEGPGHGRPFWRVFAWSTPHYPDDAEANPPLTPTLSPPAGRGSKRPPHAANH